MPRAAAFSIESFGITGIEAIEATPTRRQEHSGEAELTSEVALQRSADYVAGLVAFILSVKSRLLDDASVPATADPIAALANRRFRCCGMFPGECFR